MVDTPAAAGDLLIEVFDDGGIRVSPPAGRAGIATLAETVKWAEAVGAAGGRVRVTGAIESSRVAAVLDALEPRPATIEAGSPQPWRRGWTSLMWAADHGLERVVTDLVARGAPTGASRPWRLSPYRLAMRRGHVPVMLALRAAGVRDPARVRPPGAPDAVVMRPYIGFFLWPMAAVPVIIGIVAAVATGSPMAAIVGLALGVLLVVLGRFIDSMAGRTVVAVDGPLLYSRRLTRWRGPVDLRHLVAVGLRETLHQRSPTLLRLANGTAAETGEGEPPARPTVAAGFDDEIVTMLRERPGVRVLTIYMSATYLRPGLERHVLAHLDRTRTVVSSSAEARFVAITPPT
ncbi:ankyrin repeat domain-containing protein [Desertimonas flava]|uniref:ankyrin repeat domain-containing protein n=1 Tax=Desertimonas flava TaxID=2064846 RepID=UPI000E3484C7|nr:ankyrin repeat domain-containing protein [Desertimonas flava]